MRKLGLLILTLVSLNALGQKKLPGYYSSRTADLGFFVTRIQLNQDSTFKYEFSGDLFYDTGTGNYRLEKNRLIRLEFDKSTLDSIDQIDFALQNARAQNRPKQLLYKSNRLFLFDKEGHIVRKNYLKMRKGQKLIFRAEKQAANKQ